VADACGRCGGKGWRWTGTARLRCTARLCGSSTTPPRDPVLLDNADWIPVPDWPAMSARLTAHEARHR